MSDPQSIVAEGLHRDAIWRGLDLSGVTLVLGVGTGRLVQLLYQQVRDSDGQLVVLSLASQPLQPLLPLCERDNLLLLQGRTRQIPLLDETVDLLVVNGLLREAPESQLEALAEELWRVLVDGGRLRISDILAPTEADAHLAWGERVRIVRRLGRALRKATAVAVDVRKAASALLAVGFENLAVSLLPGLPLTDAWLEETVAAIRSMAGRLVDHTLRDEILHRDLNRLIAAYSAGDQRAAERFVLQGSKPGDMALEMEASFTESDLSGGD